MIIKMWNSCQFYYTLKKYLISLTFKLTPICHSYWLLTFRADFFTRKQCVFEVWDKTLTKSRSFAFLNLSNYLTFLVIKLSSIKYWGDFKRLKTNLKYTKKCILYCIFFLDSTKRKIVWIKITTILKGCVSVIL